MDEFPNDTGRFLFATTVDRIPPSKYYVFRRTEAPITSSRVTTVTVTHDSNIILQKVRVCASHATQPSVDVGGRLSRFCQRCGQFHDIEEFDGEKRSCRKKLELHNERRRKWRYEQVRTTIPQLEMKKVLEPKTTLAAHRR